eukprot:1925064-Prymnesium_polylepis.1
MLRSWATLSIPRACTTSACDLGQPDPSAVALLDTSAATHASVGKLPVSKTLPSQIPSTSRRRTG